MTNILVEIFNKRFAAAVESSGVKSYRELSRKADLSNPMVHKLMNGHYDNSKVGPGLFTVKRLADALGTSVGYLLGEDLATDKTEKEFFNGTNRSRGMFEILMEIHWRGAGRLEAFGDALEDCDIYAIPEPTQQTPNIVRVGSRTLFAGRLGGPFAKDAQKELNKMSGEKRQEILRFHRRVVQEGTAIDSAFLDHKMVTRASHVRASNSRLGLLVEDADGNQCIVLHAMPIPV